MNESTYIYLIWIDDGNDVTIDSAFRHREAAETRAEAINLGDDEATGVIGHAVVYQVALDDPWKMTSWPPPIADLIAILKTAKDHAAPLATDGDPPK